MSAAKVTAFASTRPTNCARSQCATAKSRDRAKRGAGLRAGAYRSRARIAVPTTRTPTINVPAWPMKTCRLREPQNYNLLQSIRNVIPTVTESPRKAGTCAFL